MKAPSRVLAAAMLCLLVTLQAHSQTRESRASATHLGVGVLHAVDAKARTFTISHQAMPSLGMAAMTMDFRVARGLSVGNVKEGDTVAFILGRDGKSDGVAIVSLQKVETTQGSQGPASSSAPMSMEKCRQMMAPRK
jgi:Cu/Ag efflux protein CusF